MARWRYPQHKLYPDNWKAIAWNVKSRANWKCQACGVANGCTALNAGVPYYSRQFQRYVYPRSPGSVLTVHHIDFNPQNNDIDNLIALCQRCHLRVQGMMSQPRTKSEIIDRLKDQGRQLYFK